MWNADHVRKVVAGIVVLAVLTLIGLGVWMGTGGANAAGVSARSPSRHHHHRSLVTEASGNTADGRRVAVTCTALTGTLVSGAGVVSGCQSYGIRSGRETQTGGSGVARISSLTSVQITWNPPFEGSTKAKPAVMMIRGSVRSSYPGVNGSRDSCPANTSLFEVAGTVIKDSARRGDLGGSTMAAVCFDTDPSSTSIISEPGSLITIFYPTRS